MKNLPKSSSFCSFFQSISKYLNAQENESERVGMLRSSPYQKITVGLSCHYRFFDIPVCMYCIAFHLSAVCLQLTYKTSFKAKVYSGLVATWLLHIDGDTFAKGVKIT